MPSMGVYYVATGPRHLKEAIGSAASVKACMPGMPTAICTDLPHRVNGLFDRVILARDVQHEHTDKAANLLQSPFDKTLYLDTDTYVCKDCSDVFQLLDRFELAAAHAPARQRSNVPECPEAFPELNAGVIAFRQGKPFEALMDDWLAIYRTQMERDPEHTCDQGPFRKAVYLSSVSLYVLPPEYNFRTIFPCFAGLNGEVKIIHGRDRNMKRVAAKINATRSARVFMPRFFLTRYEHFGILSPIGSNLGAVLSTIMKVPIMTKLLFEGKRSLSGQMDHQIGNDHWYFRHK